MSRLSITRSFPLLDIEIDRSGDGRTVTAYAATFGEPYEVRDQEGHYFESIDRTAFNRTIGRGIGSVGVFYNHGRTLEGVSSERYSMPLGTPIEVKADKSGLLTVTRYARTPLGDEVLELIGDGAIRSQSFRGQIYGSAPAARHASGLPLIKRTELGLIEYGPTPFPANAGAAMVSVRSTELLQIDPAEMTPEQLAELRALLDEIDPPQAPSGPPADPSEQGTPPQAPADGGPPAGSDLSQLELAQQQREQQLRIEAQGGPK
jgi:HK97 family phage prohead protease